MRSRRCLRRPRLQNRLKNTPRLQLPKPPTSRSLLSDPRNPPNDQPPTTNHRLSPSCQARYPPIKSKLQLPAARRRDGRVAEGARLESVFRGNSNVGSNPTLSARFKVLTASCNQFVITLPASASSTTLEWACAISLVTTSP